MQWTRLSLTNFLSHRDTTLKLTRINSITGPNGSGKSSIRDALQWVITGTCRGMNKKKDHIGVIRQGAKKAEVDLLFELNNQLYHINRSVTPSTHNLSLDEVDGDMSYVGVAATQPAIYKLLGITEEIADLIFDAYSIPSMKGSIRKQTLQRFFSASGKDALKAYLGKQGFAKLPEHHMDAILSAYTAIGLGTSEKGAYGYPVGQRRAMKRDLDTLKSNKPQGADYEPQDTSVEGLREELQALLDERDETHALASFDQGRLSSVKESITNLEKAQQNLVDKFEMDREMVEAEKTVATEKRDEAAKAVDDLLVKPKSDDAPDTNQPVRISYEKALVSMEQVEGVSVKSIAAMKKRIGSLQPAEQPKPEPEVEPEVDPALTAARDVLVAAQSDYANTLEWAGKQIQSIDEHRRNEELLTAMRTEVETLNSAKDEITATEKQAQIDSVNADIEVKQNSIEQAILADNFEQQNTDYVANIKKLEKKIARWDSLAKALDPKNPDLSDLLGDEFKTFSAFVANDSAALGVKAMVNTDFTIDISTKDGPISNLEWASKSEQYRVGVALLFGICDLVGLKSVVLDEGEVVFGANRKALRHLLKSATGLKTIVYLETDHPHVRPSSNKAVSIHNIVDGALVDYSECACAKCRKERA